MHSGKAEAGSTWYSGGVMVKNMTSGSLELNFKNAKPWMNGCQQEVDLLELGRFLLSILPAGSFFPLGFDAPAHWDLLTFY